VISVWCGPPGGPPAYARRADETHYAASLMKLPVLVALFRSAVSLDSPVPVKPAFPPNRAGDSDDEPWRRATATPRWLATRMVTRSSNLAANVLLDLVGLPAVADAWRAAGARHSVTARAIDDAAARAAGRTNLVTAADVAALLSGIALGTVAAPEACRAMLDILLDQRRREDLPTGLPPGTRIAHKNGWVHGVRHGAAVVYPDDAPPYVLVVCATTPLATRGTGDAACALLGRLAAASWAGRHREPGLGPDRPAGDHSIGARGFGTAGSPESATS
jgi:beta-lactamase class A